MDKDKKLEIYEKYRKLFIEERDYYRIDVMDIKAVLNGDCRFDEVLTICNELQDITERHNKNMEILIDNMLTEIK